MAAEEKSGAPIILERYRLLRQLGEGGMGLVYEAVHIHLGSKYAVKALRPAGPLPPDQMQELQKRFLREAKICVAVKHPNLVPVTDFGVTQGVPYIVMEFIDGEDLQHVVDREGALGEEHSLKIVRDIASALGSLHGKGIIHRDMKPANIMIERASGKVVLTDLGIAKDSSSSVNLTQGILGTPAYMAPEQVMDTASTGPESDVYGLGATFYSSLTGKRPFEGETAITIIQSARENLFAYGSIAGVSENRDGVRFSPGIHQLLHDMTTYERKDRLQNMKEVVARAEKILEAASGRKVPSSNELTLHLEGGKEPQAAPRPSTQQRTSRRAGASAKSASRPKPSVIAALSAADTTTGPRTGGKGGIVTALVVLLAAAVGGGYFAIQKKLIVIPGLNAPKGNGNGNGGGGGNGEAPGGNSGNANVGGNGDATTPVQPPAGPKHLDPSTAPKSLKLAIAGAPPIELVLVLPGKFKIGTPGSDSPAETPSREVEITRAFYIGRHEVTVGQYAAFLTACPPRSSAIPGMDLEVMGLVSEGAVWKARPNAARMPIRHVPHYMARRFCEWVSEATALEAEIPGEVAWEYAARGPKSSIYPWGNDWEDGLASAMGAEGPSEVGSYPEGKSWCGAFDMAGNVFEWTADEYVKERYKDLSARDPEVTGAGSSSGFRTIRGGCFGNDDYVCRSAHRMGMKGSARQKALGFRMVLNATGAVLDYIKANPVPSEKAEPGPDAPAAPSVRPTGAAGSDKEPGVPPAPSVRPRAEPDVPAAEE